MNVHKVEIAKTPHGEKILLDGIEVKGLKDFTLVRKANNLGVLQLELYVGDVSAVDRQANYEAKKFEEWAHDFNRRFASTAPIQSITLDSKEIFKAVSDAMEKGYASGGFVKNPTIFT